MLYISLSAVFIKKANNFNKTWLKHIEYAESEFRTIEFVYFLVVNNNKYLSYIVDNTIFGISVPDYPVEPLKASLYDYFVI